MAGAVFGQADMFAPKSRAKKQKAEQATGRAFTDARPAQREKLPPLVLPTAPSPEAVAYLEGFDHQLAAYRAWRSTALFLAGQSITDPDQARELLAGAFDAYDRAAQIANRFTDRPELWHIYSAGREACPCSTCLWDVLSHRWEEL